MSLSSYLATNLFFFPTTATTQIYTLSLHDALPISRRARSAHHFPRRAGGRDARGAGRARWLTPRSEEHTSELQSHHDIVCRLLLEKKNFKKISFSRTSSYKLNIDVGKEYCLLMPMW